MGRVLVVGASRGIGFEFCKQLVARGHEVYATVRSRSPALEQMGVRCWAGVDVTASEGLRQVAQELGAIKLDLFIHNAGIFLNETLENLNFETMTQQFQVNTLGALRSVQAFMPLFKEGTKVAFLTSRMGSIADNGSGAYYGYRMSKAALNAAAKSLSIDLKPRKVMVTVLHPGYVQTDMTGHPGEITPEVSVQGMLRVLDQLTLADTGTFWHTNGEALPW